MLQKIHCNLFDIYGLDWAEVSPTQVDCIINSIHKMKLISSNDELFGFVGTVDSNRVIGGYFVVQFPTELTSYKPDKTALVERASPAEPTLFVLFPCVGRLLLQSHHFQILRVGTEAVQNRLKEALTRVLTGCKVGPLVGIFPTPITIGGGELIQVFKSSTKVTRLSVSDPDAERIPEDFVYYNPDIYRNSIIRDSRRHDYPKLRKIDITAKPNSDIRDTHLGSDLVHTVHDESTFLMTYEDEHNEPKTLRRQRRARHEFYIDIDGKQLSCEALQHILQIVSQDAAIDIPVRVLDAPSAQPSLFDYDEDEFDEE